MGAECARLARKSAAYDLFYFAVMQIDARTKHWLKLEPGVYNSMRNVSRI